MGLSIIRYQHRNAKNAKDAEYGVLKGDMIVPIAGTYATLGDFLQQGREEAVAADGKEGVISVEEVKILSPITRPCRLLCQGVNYAKHRVEAGAADHGTAENLYFRKDDSSIIDPHDDIQFPKDVVLFDYEVELGIVIGKTIDSPTKVTAENLSSYAAGVLLCNDMSVREWMFKQPFGQWFKGKSPRKSSPFGPVLYLFEAAADVELIDKLNIRLWVNDELRQDAHTSQLLVKPAQALSEISTWVDMEPGDVLMTGTPGGVSFRMPKPFPKTVSEFIAAQQNTGVNWLKPGDTVRAELVAADESVHLGIQKNKIVEQQAL